MWGHAYLQRCRTWFFWLIMINPGHIPSQAKKVQHYIQLTITSSTSIFCLYVDLELQQPVHHLVDIDSLWGTSQTSSDLAHLINVVAEVNAKKVHLYDALMLIFKPTLCPLIVKLLVIWSTWGRRWMPQCFKTLVLVFSVFFEWLEYVVKLGGENRANLTPNFWTQEEKLGLRSQLDTNLDAIWWQFGASAS